MTTLVWFKRDLRTVDHAPLYAAVELGEPVIPLYVVEPDYWLLADTSERQCSFVADSLVDLDRQLKGLGGRLCVRQGNVIDVLNQLRERFGVDRIFAHEETGNEWTFTRDRQVIGWCADYGVAFHEWQQFGVIRRLRDRDKWDGAWKNLMGQTPLPRPGAIRMPEHMTVANTFDSPPLLDQRPCPQRQPGGSRAGAKLLSSFLERRCIGYQYNISSPNTATKGCSRLSPHIANGTVSLRQIYQQSKGLGSSNNTLARKKRSLTSFRSRLHWHCHFIQKLEDEPEMEFRAIHRELETLKQSPNDTERLDRWREGMTGWPLVDACMRALHHAGWINFRMRAMLMSTASYQLWLHWRDPALHLARLFTDFEPGIHYPQAQMQSGLTGINALRIYNPELQSRKLDPEGEFIRHWLPELEGVPTDFIHSPWHMSTRQHARFGGDQYPAPICDHEAAARNARKKVGEFRQKHVSREETNRVLDRHGSRKGPRQARPKVRKSQSSQSTQLSLFE